MMASGDDVSDEERLLIHMILAGSGDAHIARELCMSLRSMQRLLRSIMDRIGAPNRAMLGAVAAHRGWVDPDSFRPNFDGASGTAHHQGHDPDSTRTIEPLALHPEGAGT
jgi:DNA-binding CsgD family transcriptional regulator